MIKLVIFDLDGTLIDAYTAIQKSLNFTLKALGHKPVGANIVRRKVGHGDVNFMREFFKEEEAIKALRIYRRHHKQSLCKHAWAISDAKRVLGALKKRGYKLAVASNRPKKFSNILLKCLSLERYFKIVLCGKDKNDIKPRPTLLLKILRRLKIKKNEAVYVGDMTVDVYAGRNAGVKTIAVMGGSSTTAQLKKAGPFKVIKRLPELLKVI